ncbi:DUF916 and DUF3324 domain-containing protein [Listeria rocourtiae]|uniref:DUF916 and DUF3324 domain-containing protein n=1 Tax=Listeria rocourtiae TaxID=647910 RepID=UPI001629F9B6|nr:DUF916 and DUF3324 domain-containing protein [Listeria rocourtiae]MBC1604585.1 DUF916 and DUF3324 domain-containing protein [Listeria rocourtiae]
MKKIIEAVIMIGVIFGGIIVHIEPSKAVETDFSVSALIPDNQIDKSKKYFELRMKPSQVQELEVLLTNNLARPMTIEMHANTAVTNDYGTVDYSNKAPQFDNTLQFPFSEIAEMPDEIMLHANGSRKMKVKLRMPSVPFDGLILGGLHFSEKGGLGDYVIGVILSEKDTVVEPDMKLNGVKPSQISKRNVLKVNLQNIKPVILQNLVVEARIYKENSDEVLYRTKRDMLRMAPNSNFDLGISWKNQAFEAGKYRLKIVATSEHNIWKWNEEFEIEKDLATKLNRRAVGIEKSFALWYIGCGVVLLMLGWAFLMNRQKTRKSK